MASSERFGYEWDKYSSIDKNYEAQFKNWTFPLIESDFTDKVILDAGCGMGRNSLWPLVWGAKEVIAFDLDPRSVKRAGQNLAKFPQATVVQKSIYEINWREYFDMVFSIGVIHHLEDPKKALRNMVVSLKNGGMFLVWVYSYEGNEWIVKYVNPIRVHITSKLPLPIVHFISYFSSIPLWLFVKMNSHQNGYFKQLAGFGFKHVHSIVFDQLIPKVANYWSKADVEELCSDIGLKDFSVAMPPNKMGWTVIGKK